MFDRSVIQRGDDVQFEKLSYLNSMNEPVSLAQVPLRIVQRYTENLQYLVSSVAEFVGGLSGGVDTSIGRVNSEQDTFGIDKTFVLLTKPNKVIAVSSLTGQILWARRIPSEVRNLFVTESIELQSVQIRVVTASSELITINPLTGTIESQTQLPELGQPIEETEFMLISGVSAQGERARKALIALPRHGEGKAVMLEAGLRFENVRPFYVT